MSNAQALLITALRNVTAEPESKLTEESFLNGKHCLEILRRLTKPFHNAQKTQGLHCS